jgi:hypothetical protein
MKSAQKSPDVPNASRKVTRKAYYFTGGFIKLFFVVVVICHSLKRVPIGIPIMAK